MLTRSQIQFVQSLKQKKHRDREQCFVAEGPKLVMELLHSRFTIRYLYALTSWMEENRTEIPGVDPLRVTNREMERMTGLATGSVVLAVVEIPGAETLPDLVPDDFTLLLDEIRDPGNLGTIIRVADWFGIPQVVCSPGTVDLYNPKVVQGSMGSISRVRVSYRDLPSLLAEKAGMMPVYGMMMTGTDLFSTPPEPGGFILVGNEARGLSPSLEPFITHPVTIPFYPPDRTSHAESLNAAVAAGIVCAAFRFNRTTK